ncbi:unnamed protein product [Victoria cruziana]
MDAGPGEYRLSCELRGHEADVRGVCVCGDTAIATSSRDKTVKFWVQNSDNGYKLSKTMAEHTSFVGPLAWIAPSNDLLEGGIVSGGMDTMVLLWDLKSARTVHRMSGHQLQVTGLAIDGCDIVSSSIDCTIKRWRKGQVVDSWEAHKAPVQAVVRLSSGELVTGSSDASLKLWRDKTCTDTFTGHTDTVRSLAAISDVGILSASHDGTIKLWSFAGEILIEMVGHASLVYSVDSHVSGLIASGSEDCSAKIWKDGTCIQTVEHPGCVWDVKFLSNGDIVTACSDGVARIWTTNRDRMSGPLDVEAYAARLSEYKCNRKRVGGLKLADLPGLEALQIPGSHDGQTKVVREGDNGVAYSWNLRQQKWEKIGEVVDGPDDNTSNRFLDGVKYDYVFDVDIGDGEPIRKLPYNKADNPYTVADKWLLKEDLPLSYRQQVVEFILQNTGQRDIPVDASFHDPYTGANAYVPGESSRSQGMLLFDSAQFDGILKKFLEFNDTLSRDVEQSHLSIKEMELARLNAIMTVLKDTSHYHSSTFADMDIRLLEKLLDSWPITMLFPVIDIMRMFVLHPDGARLLHKYSEGHDVLIKMVQKATQDLPLTANLLTGARAVVNLFKHSYFHKWLHLYYSEILDRFSSCCTSTNKNVQLAYSTLLLNFAVLLIQEKDQEGQAQVLSAALEIAEDNQDPDAKFRALVAIGSLMLEGLMKQVALDFDVKNIAKTAMNSKEAKIAEVGADIEYLTRTP